MPDIAPGGGQNQREVLEVADYKLLGKNYQLPDLRAKVTGRSRYAEDHRAEGMVFCKLLVSPMPHARVVSRDTSAAEALPGVAGILTADDLPEVDVPNEAAPEYVGAVRSQRGRVRESRRSGGAADLGALLRSGHTWRV